MRLIGLGNEQGRGSGGARRWVNRNSVTCIVGHLAAGSFRHRMSRNRESGPIGKSNSSPILESTIKDRTGYFQGCPGQLTVGTLLRG
jgi:hypothetical protein